MLSWHRTNWKASIFGTSISLDLNSGLEGALQCHLSALPLCSGSSGSLGYTTPLSVKEKIKSSEMLFSAGPRYSTGHPGELSGQRQEGHREERVRQKTHGKSSAWERAQALENQKQETDDRISGTNSGFTSKRLKPTGLYLLFQGGG